MRNCWCFWGSVAKKISVERLELGGGWSKTGMLDSGRWLDGRYIAGVQATQE